MVLKTKIKQIFTNNFNRESFKLFQQAGFDVQLIHINSIAKHPYEKAA